MDDPLVPSPPGTEEHYLVMSPGTPPLGRDTDAKISEALADFGDSTHSLDFVLRVADPDRVHKPPKVDYWLLVRVFPGLHTIETATGRVRFSGSAYRLSPSGEMDGEELTCSATLSITDQAPGNVIGEIRIAGLTGTTNGGTP
jgi:hypothetical protein